MTAVIQLKFFDAEGTVCVQVVVFRFSSVHTFSEFQVSKVIYLLTTTLVLISLFRKWPLTRPVSIVVIANFLLRVFM